MTSSQLQMRWCWRSKRARSPPQRPTRMSWRLPSLDPWCENIQCASPWKYNIQVWIHIVPLFIRVDVGIQNVQLEEHLELSDCHHSLTSIFLSNRSNLFWFLGVFQKLYFYSLLSAKLNSKSIVHLSTFVHSVLIFFLFLGFIFCLCYVLASCHVVLLLISSKMYTLCAHVHK